MLYFNFLFSKPFFGYASFFQTRKDGYMKIVGMLS